MGRDAAGIRSFVALDVDGPAADRLLGLAAACPVGRRVPPENLHLTLAFLGDQPRSALEALDEELAAIHLQPFEVTLRGLDLFGPRGGVLAARAEVSPALTDLHVRIARAIRRAGLRTESRRFRPHVSFVRLSDHAASADAARLQAFLDAQAQFGPVSFHVGGFTLYRSTLGPKGARHDALAEYS